MNAFTVTALYHFTSFPDREAIKALLDDGLMGTSVKGTLLIAHEGINGTIAGTPEDIAAALTLIKSLPGCAALEHKESTAEEIPFHRLKVRLKKEIVTLGVETVDPTSNVGNYVDPADWNALISDPNTVLIDTRNDYEVAIGSFEGALDPKTTSFREFPEWFEAHRAELEGKKVAMFCTGGIRCEKSTSYLKGEGIDDVYHLKGGILKYLEHVPQEESKWWGECFVFDNRVSLKHGLEEGTYDMCHACRRPITEEEKLSELYIPGVACPYCYDEKSEAQKRRYAARQKQMVLARQRGEAHIGVRPPEKTKSISDDTPLDEEIL